MIGDGALGVVDEAAEIAASGVDVDVDVAGELAVLVANHRWAFDDPQCGELPERNLRAIRRGYEYTPELVDLIAQLTRIANVDRISLAAFDRGGDVLAADRGHDRLLHVIDGEAIAGDRRAVNVEIDEVAARDALAVDAARAGDAADDLLELLADVLDLLQICAVDLDPDRRADSGGQHVDAIADRHRPGVCLSRQLQPLVEIVDQLVIRQISPPLRFRLEDDGRLHH